MYVITHGISSNHWLKTPMTEVIKKQFKYFAAFCFFSRIFYEQFGKIFYGKAIQRLVHACSFESILIIVYSKFINFSGYPVKLAKANNICLEKIIQRNTAEMNRDYED